MELFALNFRRFRELGAKRFAGLLPPGYLGKYILLVGAVGTGTLLFAVTRLPVERADILIALYVMIFLTEWAPIRLAGTPLQGSYLSVSAAIAFAALLISGPFGSVVVNTGSGLAYCLKDKRPFYKRWFTMATIVCSSGVAGLVYYLAGGQVPLVFEPGSVVAAAPAAAAYFLTNASLMSGAISLQSGRPFRSVLTAWQWLFLQMLTSLAIGLIMALALASGVGKVGFVLVCLLLILPWYSTYFYVQKSRQVAEQNEQLKKMNKGLEEANRALDRHVEELRALHNISLSLNSIQNLPAILQEILSSVVKLVGADASAVFLCDAAGRNPLIAGQVGLTADYVSASEMALDGSAVRALSEARLLVMDKNNYVPAMLSAAAAREGIMSAACLPLKVGGEVVGGLDVCFKSEHAFSSDEIRLLKTLGEQAAVAIQNGRLLEKVHESYLSTIRALAAAVEAKDPYTRGHSEVVRQLAIATGRQMGLYTGELEKLSIAALFHDIGKIGISELILNKPDTLTQVEWPLMRQHPIIGERILSKVPALDNVPSVVRHHHERFDGQGYPDGICAREDLLAAIISVCDTYQAMTNDRPYRKAFSQSQALEEICRCSGTQFVPEVVEAFIAAVNHQDLLQYQSNRLDPGLGMLQQASALRRESSPAVGTDQAGQARGQMGERRNAI